LKSLFHLLKSDFDRKIDVQIKNVDTQINAKENEIKENDKQLQKALAEKKQGNDAVALILYSNEVQQNLRYYNTLDEK